MSETGVTRLLLSDELEYVQRIELKDEVRRRDCSNLSLQTKLGKAKARQLENCCV